MRNDLAEPEMRVAMLSALPAESGHRQSGVAAYTASLLRSLSADLDVVALAQRNVHHQRLGPAKVIPTWTPDPRVVVHVWRAITHRRPTLLHVQHEFNLYGGFIPTSLMTAALIALRRRGLLVVTTVHGVVDPADVTHALVARNSLPGSPAFARRAFRVSYTAISAASDALLVHHEHFRDILVARYGVPRTKVHVVPMGGDLVQPTAHNRAGGRRVLVLGFLTGYKLPELVADVAESESFPGAVFSFCVGFNPRVDNRRYRERYRRLRARVQRIEDRAEWVGYVPEDQLQATLAEADILVLPYTECIAMSAVAALANAAGLAICYSRPLRPLFGAGPLEFELTREALAASLEYAARGQSLVNKSPFVPWSEAAAATEATWRDVIARR